MKKIGLWKKIASWLLVFLLVLQIPVDTFAEEWISGNDISVETDFTENENSNNEEEENTDFYSDGNIEESEGDSFTDSDELPEADIVSFSDGTSLSEDTETQEIQVTVSVSKDGKFLNDKDGKPMAGRTVLLSGKASYTMDDALKLAHDLYYPGGSEAGYDYHADEAGLYYGLIYKLWGINRDDVPFIKSVLNNDSANYQTSLNRLIHDGDDLCFFIQKRKSVDSYAYFTRKTQTVFAGQDITLQLKETSDAHIYSNCQRASIYIDGEKAEGLITDEQGKVTISGLESREKPYFITAEKMEDADHMAGSLIGPCHAIRSTDANLLRREVSSSGRTCHTDVPVRPGESEYARSQRRGRTRVPEGNTRNSRWCNRKLFPRPGIRASCEYPGRCRAHSGTQRDAGRPN